MNNKSSPWRTRKSITSPWFGTTEEIRVEYAAGAQCQFMTAAEEINSESGLVREKVPVCFLPMKAAGSLGQRTNKTLLIHGSVP